eukprot:1737152-Pyramimonas_sp.AAC.1
MAGLGSILGVVGCGGMQPTSCYDAPKARNGCFRCTTHRTAFSSITPRYPRVCGCGFLGSAGVASSGLPVWLPRVCGCGFLGSAGVTPAHIRRRLQVNIMY